MLFRNVVSLAVPASLGIAAFLHAQAIGALIGATVQAPASIAPFAEARAAIRRNEKSAEAILARNPFDHRRGSTATPLCDGVGVAISVEGETPEASLAALDLGGRHLLRRPGARVGELLIERIGADRVVFSREGIRCEVPVTRRPALKPTQPLGPGITRVGPTEFQIDRSEVERLFAGRRAPWVPDGAGFRIVSPIAGLEAGDVLLTVEGIELTDMARMVELYARFQAGVLDRMTLHVRRSGKPLNLDYVIR